MSRQSRFAPYKAALDALSTRTGTPIPSLALSFAVLHEATAILPVIGLFYTCRALGAGDAAVRYIHSHRVSQTEGFDSSILSRANIYLEEGEARAARFGKRYGLWGLDSEENEAETGLNLAGDIANAAVAYGITKVCSKF